MSLANVDFVPASIPEHFANTRLIMVEDNDAVIKCLKKGRAPSMQHVARTHRVNLDWLLERSFIDPCIYCRYILDTKAQLADILTKSQFSSFDWCNLCELFRLSRPPAPLKVAPVRTQVSEGRKIHTVPCEENDVLFVAESRLLAGHSLILTSELDKLRKASDLLRSVRKQRRRAKRQQNKNAKT